MMILRIGSRISVAGRRLAATGLFFRPSSLPCRQAGIVPALPAGRHRPSSGFTLVELLAAVAVISVGMVFILGAFNQCVASLATAQKMTTANYLLNNKLWEIDFEAVANNGSVEGGWSEAFAAPYAVYNWTQVIRPITADFGNATSFVQEDLLEETLTISWAQAKTIKNLSVTRYVRKKKET